MKTARQVALDAAKAIREIGWCQGQFRTVDDAGACTGFCAIGAIRYASGYYANLDQPIKEFKLSAGLARAVTDMIDSVTVDLGLYSKEFRRESGSPLVDFNDCQERKAEEVADLLEKAAEHLPDELPTLEAWYTED